MLCKEVFEVIIGAWQVGNIIAMKETRPVTARDLEKMVNGRSQIASMRLVAFHRAEQPNDTPLNLFATCLILIGEKVGE